MNIPHKFSITNSLTAIFDRETHRSYLSLTHTHTTPGGHHDKTQSGSEKLKHMGIRISVPFNNFPAV